MIASHCSHSGEDSTQSHASGKDTDVSAYLSYRWFNSHKSRGVGSPSSHSFFHSGAAAVSQLQQARTLCPSGVPNVYMRRVTVDDSAVGTRADAGLVAVDAGSSSAPTNDNAFQFSAPLFSSTRCASFSCPQFHIVTLCSS